MSESPWQATKPTLWPQDQLQVPLLGERSMPHVDRANAEYAERESFVMAAEYLQAGVAIAAGQVIELFIQTDQDGDFWCDQIFCTSFNHSIDYQNRAISGFTIDISDARTGRMLTYPPRSCPAQFFNTLVLFSDDTGYDPSANPLPDGFRSTSTIPQPFCFTRQGGIQISLQAYAAISGAQRFLYFAFSGWKEYRHASG